MNLWHQIREAGARALWEYENGGRPGKSWERTHSAERLMYHKKVEVVIRAIYRFLNRGKS